MEISKNFFVKMGVEGYPFLKSNRFDVSSVEKGRQKFLESGKVFFQIFLRKSFVYEEETYSSPVKNLESGIIGKKVSKDDLLKIPEEKIKVEFSTGFNDVWLVSEIVRYLDDINEAYIIKAPNGIYFDPKGFNVFYNIESQNWENLR